MEMIMFRLALLVVVCLFGEVAAYGSYGGWSYPKAVDRSEDEDPVKPSHHFLLPSHEVQPKQDYSYTKNGGAKEWASVFPECGGNRQSPVDIKSTSLKRQPFPPLVFSNYWNNTNTALLNNTGKHVKVKLQGNGKLPSLRGGPLSDRYTFVELHFHWGPDDFEGSEHLLNGFPSSMEAHLVHFKSSYETMEEAAKHKDGLAVVAFFIQAIKRETNEKFQELVSSLEKVRKAFSTTQLTSPSAAFQWLRGRTRDDFISYQGSLTTPPCSEVVSWIVIPSPIIVSSKQVEEFRLMKTNDGSRIKFNYRPVQRYFVNDIVTSG